MDDEKPFSHGKRKVGNFRKHSYSHPDSGKRKRQNSSHDHNFMTSKPVDTIYRILCPVKKIGSVLGKGGDIVNALRDETHAKIRVADAIPGAEERVIIIFSYLSQQSGELNTDSDPDDVNFTKNESEGMKCHCPAQDALLKVHDRIAADEVLRGGVLHENTEADDSVTVRILVPSNQVGCLLGKGGTVIQKLRSDTGANIRILPAEHLPPCAMSTDELVQISGMPSIVKKALYDISALLHQHPRKENPPLEDIIYASTQGSYQSGASVPPPLPQGNPMWSQRHPGVDAAPPVPWFGGYRNEPSGYAPSNFSSSRAGNDGETAEFSIRILCATGKIGGVIGKGGVNVRQLEQQTRARIQVEDTAPEAEERVIVISSKEVPWDPISPTIEALLQLQTRTGATSEKGVITTRLLVPSSKVGCILGQGGDIITEMRRRTRADIRVFSKDDKPEYTSANEELVQVSGNQSVAREALSEIASRLRARTLRGGNAAANAAPPAPFRGFPPSESLSSRALPQTVNASINPAPTVPLHGFSPLEGFPGRGLSSAMVGAGNAVNYDHPRGSGQIHEAHGYPGPQIASSYPTVNSSVEVKISSSAVASVLGAGGSNVSDTRQISGARFRLHDPLSRVSECVVEIRGSSDQMKGAQGLFHAFVASGGQNVPPPATRPY